MAFGTKISELPAATSLTGLELTVVVQGGETRRSTVEAMEASVSQRVDVVSALASANAAAITSTNAVVSLKVNRAGDTMTGALTLSGNPTAVLHAAPKQYVDVGDRWVTIADQAITNVAEIDVTWTNGAYLTVRAYILSYLPATLASGIPYVRVRAGGAWKTSALDYSTQYSVMEGTSYQSAEATAYHMRLADTFTNVANDHGMAIIDIDPGPGVTGGEAGFTVQNKWTRAAGSRRVLTGMGSVQVGSATVDGLRFGMINNWAAVGRILVVGVKA